MVNPVLNSTVLNISGKAYYYMPSFADVMYCNQKITEVTHSYITLLIICIIVIVCLLWYTIFYS